jgi:hypothetical protein
MTDNKHLQTDESSTPKITPEFHLANINSNDNQHNSHSDEEHEVIEISKYTMALIKIWKTGVIKTASSVNKISVSQTVSFMAFLYEKIRNAVEFKEEHLIRRASIERMLKRRMILNENGRDISERLIKELLWARYYENNTIGEDKIEEIQSVVDKYFFLRNELSRGRKSGEQEKVSQFMIEVLSCEIEERLSPNSRREAFTNFVYQIMKPKIAPFDLNDEMERDIQVYIAVEKAFGHSDIPLIKYHLLKLMIPEITAISWKNSERILPNFIDVYKQIQHSINHPFTDKTRNAVRKHIPPFLILRDIFQENSTGITSILTDDKKLKYSVDELCRKRYSESRGKLRRTAVRSFIYILLTKVVFALIIEIPYDYYIAKTISYIPIAINVLFPPLFMTLIILTVNIPGDDNTKKMFQLIRDIITIDPVEDVSKAVIVGRKSKSKGIIFSTLFTGLYLLTYFITFGGIIYLLSQMHFNPVSQTIFIFFLTLVTFFAFRVIQITQEYRVVENESFFTPIFDFFFLPVIRVGQWLSGEVLSKFNVLIIFFDLIIEMPFKAIVEVFDEWVKFMKIKKDEIL